MSKKDERIRELENQLRRVNRHGIKQSAELLGIHAVIQVLKDKLANRDGQIKKLEFENNRLIGLVNELGEENERLRSSIPDPWPHVPYTEAIKPGAYEYRATTGGTDDILDF